MLEHLRTEVGEHGFCALSEERDGMLVSGKPAEGNPHAGTDVGITNAVVRNALNLSAWYPSFSTWDPSAGTMPISPVAPCTQVGWGVVNMSNIQPMIEHLNGTQTMSDRPGDVECMQINQLEKPIGEFIHPTSGRLNLGANVQHDLEPNYGKPTQYVVLAPIVGLEPTTLGLTVPRSTSWA